MNTIPILEQLEINFALPTYPIECYYSINTAYLSEALLHWHNYCEMMIIHEGYVQYDINQKSYLLNSGDILYIHPNQSHSAINLAKSTKSTLIKFNVDLLLSHSNYDVECQFLRPFLPESYSSCLIFRSQEEAIQPYLDILLNENNTRKFGHEFRIKTQICMLISTLADSLGESQLRTSTMLAGEKDNFNDLLQYVEKNFAHQNLSEQALEICNLSYSNFAIKFKRFYGMTFSEYINYVRITYAQHLLTNTTHSIATIADLCGYHDSAYFSRIFSKLVKLSPLAYRQTQSPK